MPVGRIVNSVTNSNWEGTSIEPDIRKKSNNALNATLQLIIEDIIEHNPPENFINRLDCSFLFEEKIDLTISILRRISSDIRNRPMFMIVWEKPIC